MTVPIILIDAAVAVFFGGFFPIITYFLIKEKLTKYFQYQSISPVIISIIFTITLSLILFTMNYKAAVNAVSQLASLIDIGGTPEVPDTSTPSKTDKGTKNVDANNDVNVSPSGKNNLIIIGNGNQNNRIETDE